MSLSKLIWGAPIIRTNEGNTEKPVTGTPPFPVSVSKTKAKIQSFRSLSSFSSLQEHFYPTVNGATWRQHLCGQAGEGQAEWVTRVRERELCLCARGGTTGYLRGRRPGERAQQRRGAQSYFQSEKEKTRPNSMVLAEIGHNHCECPWFFDLDR